MCAEGVVAELHLYEHLLQCPFIRVVEWSRDDSRPDFTLYLWNEEVLRLECKNISKREYKDSFKVQVQKSRNSKDGNPTRLYDVDRFDILAVCMGKKTGNWKDFRFCSCFNLEKIVKQDQHKIYGYQRVPKEDHPVWPDNISYLVEDYFNARI